MQISRLKALFTKGIDSQIPDTSQFFKDGKIDYEFLQKDLIKSHLQAFAYYKLLLETSLEFGCTKNIEAANRGMICHSREVSRLSGLGSYADINAAAARLEKEGYLISGDDSASEIHQ